MLRHPLVTKIGCGIMALMMGLSVFGAAGSGFRIGKNNNAITKKNLKRPSSLPIVKVEKKISPSDLSDNNTVHLQTANGNSTSNQVNASNKPTSGMSPAERIGWPEYVMLVRIIHAEAGGEPFQGQVAVGAVILNRIRSGQFPRTVTANVMKTGEFESVSNGYIWSNPTESSYRAADLAINGWDPTNGAIYFYNPAKTSSSWIWGRPIITQIGKHNFAV